MKSFFSFIAVAVLMFLVGCGEGSSSQTEVKVDAKAPVAQVKTEAAKMNQADLQKQADAYKQQISEKSSELAAKTKELKDIPITEMLGEKSKNLKTEIADMTKEIDALKARMQIYLDEIKKKAVQ